MDTARLPSSQSHYHLHHLESEKERQRFRAEALKMGVTSGQGCCKILILILITFLYLLKKYYLCIIKLLQRSHVQILIRLTKMDYVNFALLHVSGKINRPGICVWIVRVRLHREVINVKIAMKKRDTGKKEVVIVEKHWFRGSGTEEQTESKAGGTRA